jgi:hypothetical protein
LCIRKTLEVIETSYKKGMGIIKTIIINDENINKQFAKKEVKK